MKMTLETRTIAVHALRTTTAHQITTRCADHSGGRCAVGVIAEALGCNVLDMMVDPYGIVEGYGIPHAEVYQMNDGHCAPQTFAQIADWLETLPVTDPCPNTIPWNTPVEVKV